MLTRLNEFRFAHNLKTLLKCEHLVRYPCKYLYNNYNMEREKVLPSEMVTLA